MTNHKVTITEALADIKTIDKRIEKKQQFISDYLWRQAALKDPLEKDGGCFVVLAAELQAITDLEEYKLKLRRAIQQVNETTVISISGQERTIADWLVWKREVAPQMQQLYNALAQKINQARQTAQQKGYSILTVENVDARPQDIVVHLNEKDIAEAREWYEEVLGNLDGQLSLKNATTFVEL